MASHDGVRRGRTGSRPYDMAGFAMAASAIDTPHGPVRILSALDDALGDADGIVRKDFRLTDGDIPFERRTLRERIVRVAEPVCALGRYDAEQRALVPAGATLNRLWPGAPADVRRRIVATARSQAWIGLFFFVVSHAMLAVGLYLSETRHAREPEAAQASAIRHPGPRAT